MGEIEKRERRYRDAVREEPLPLAMIDLDALEHNVDVITAPVRAAGKTLRVATKSVRCVDLLRRIMARGGEVMKGVMAFSAPEAAHLVGHGFADVLIAYPIARARDAALVAEQNRAARVAVVVDAPEHLALLSAAARAAGVRVPVIVDVDVSYRPLGERGGVHLGVRRSPLRAPGEVLALAERARSSTDLVFGGLMAYEAHIAGLPDRAVGSPVGSASRRALKRLAREPLRVQRAAIAAAFERAGLSIPLWNGGGTGSVASSSEDPSLTEVTAGSGFLDSHLFDGYQGLSLTPAALFALPVTRRPAPDMVTCQGGGLIASGAVGADRAPIPYLPAGLSLTSLEGAGEVQTPLLVPPHLHLQIGDPVFFRHAKAGELAEHFTSYLLLRGDEVEARVPTYRGEGVCFH